MVNVCAHLESLTKEYNCPVIISRLAAEAAGFDLDDRELHRATARGLSQPVEFYTVAGLSDLRV